MRSPSGLQGNRIRWNDESADMSTSYRQLHVHLVWTTAQRASLLDSPIRLALSAYLNARARTLHCDLLAIGGTRDHVHALVSLHPSVDVARLARELKAPSSGYIRRRFGAPGFAWQNGYGAFTVGREQLPVIVDYIREQQRHHHEGSLIADLESVPAEDPHW